MGTPKLSQPNFKNFEDCKIKIHRVGNSPAVQWLGLGTFTATTQVQSMVRELRSYKPRSTVKQTRIK